MKPASIRTKDWYNYNLLFFMEHLLGYQRFQKYFGASQKKLYGKIDRYLAGASTGQVRELQAADKNMSKEDFLKICYDGPKVFRGAAKDWDAVKKWDLDFFEKNYGDEEIIIMDQALYQPASLRVA
jgi:hypothetical protein